MTDELDRLKAEMARATPAPDPARKAETIALAMKNFDRAQGSGTAARPTSNRFWNGVKTMTTLLTSRAGLTATTGLVAVALLMVTPLGREVFTPPTELSVSEATVTTEEAAPLVLAEPARVPPGQVTPPLARSPALGDSVTTSRLAESQLALLPAPTPEDNIRIARPNTEAFANDAPNPVRITAEDPVSTFSIDVDTASYAVVRNSLTRGQLPPPEAVRVEEMINYFPYAYPAPEDAAPFRPTISLGQTPWNPDTQLLHVALQGAQVTARPPLNLVFLIDTSGSMQNPDKLPLLQQSLRLMLPELRPEDEVAIVTYAGSAGLVLPPTAATDTAAISAALTALSAGGRTAGQAGLEQAYTTAAAMAAEGEVTRVLLATDGDFNIGLSDPDALERFIARQRDGGTYLSVLGFGRGNLDDATMQALAQSGNGQAAYIDTLAEARKVLVDQLTGALFPIADDVKIQIEFNPAQIAEYRLIGYETRSLNRTDFNDDRVDAGEIGAGHSVTALYEITPVGSPAQLSDPLRYGAAPAAETSEQLGVLRLRYKRPGTDDSTLIETPLLRLPALSEDARFAAAIAGFGQLLRGRDLGGWSYDQALALGTAARGADPFGYRAEALTLMRLTDSLDQD